MTVAAKANIVKARTTVGRGTNGETITDGAVENTKAAIGVRAEKEKTKLGHTPRADRKVGKLTVSDRYGASGSDRASKTNTKRIQSYSAS